MCFILGFLFSFKKLLKILSFCFLFLLTVSSSNIVFAKRHQNGGSQYREDYEFLSEKSDRRWSYDRMRANRDRQRSNFFFVGGAFSISGVAFGISKDVYNSVISNGFLSDRVFLGPILRFGYESSTKFGYFSAELYGALSIGASGGLVGDLATGESITLSSVGSGLVHGGANLKYGISFNRNQGAVYLILGTSYLALRGTYEKKGSDTSSFDMSGFGLNYGIGMKHLIYGVMFLFVEFVAAAPIKGHGVSGMDRTVSSSNTNSAAIKDIETLELYNLQVGLDFRF